MVWSGNLPRMIWIQNKYGSMGLLRIHVAFLPIEIGELLDVMRMDRRTHNGKKSGDKLWQNSENDNSFSACLFADLNERLSLEKGLPL